MEMVTMQRLPCVPARGNFLTKPLQMRDIEQCVRQVLQFRQNRTPASDELVVDSGHILELGRV